MIIVSFSQHYMLNTVFSAFNAIFSKTDHCASEPVIHVLYAVKACPLQIQSFEFI